MPKGIAIKHCLLKYQLSLYINNLIVSIVNDEIIIIRTITQNSIVNIRRPVAMNRAITKLNLIYILRRLLVFTQRLSSV